MSNWYRWPSLAEFTKWHEAVKAELGIPRPGKELRSGRSKTDAQWTMAYTEAYVVDSGDIRAIVESDALDVEGLGEPCDTPLIGGETEAPLIDKSGSVMEPVWTLREEARFRVAAREGLTAQDSIRLGEPQ